MVDRLPDNPSSLSALVGGIIDDLQRLIRQEIALARREFTEEWTKTKLAAGLMGAGLVGLLVALVMFGFMLVYLINLALPQVWACFGIVCGIFVVLGGLALGAGIAQLQQVRVVPPRTAQTLREDLSITSPSGPTTTSPLTRH